MNLNRRAFIKLAGTSLVCACAGGLGTSGCAGKPASSTPPAPVDSYRLLDSQVFVDLSQVGTLLGVGGAVRLTLQDGGGRELKVIVVHPGAEDYRAFANSCTHDGKELNYQHQEGRLACCGRSSLFDLAGNVLKGPAEEVLLRYRLWLDGAQLVIKV